MYFCFKAFNPFNVIFAPGLTGDLRALPLNNEEITRQVTRLLETLEAMHKPIANARAARQATQRRASLARNVKQARAAELGLRTDEITEAHCVPNFNIGDYVLVARPRLSNLSKLTAVWRGPYRILRETHQFVYEVEHLVTHEVSECHVTRLRFYSDSSLDIPVKLLDELSLEDNVTFEYHIEAILDFKYDADEEDYFLQIQWSGFSDLEITYEPLRQIYADQPKRVTQYVNLLPDTNMHKGVLLNLLAQLESEKA